MKIVMSSGHGVKIRGAAGPPPWGLDEVDEAIRVVGRTAELLRTAGVTVDTYTDTVSTTQSANLDRIVNYHNSKTRDLDVSIHFNAYTVTSKPMGTECLYVTQEELAGDVSQAIARVTGLPDRGAKYRSDLAFLNGTHEPAVLVEVVFCDSSADAAAYRNNFEAICAELAAALAGEAVEPAPEPEPEPDVKLHVTGKCSWFGGPNDTGVSPSEGLAFIYSYDARPDLFLATQPSGTTGLARRLNPDVFYVACRWDYSVTPKTMLDDKDKQALVRAGEREFLAWPADWGPHSDTGRVADISPGLMAALGIETDDQVEVIYPYAGEVPAPEPEPEVAVVRIETEGEVEVWVNGVKV
jgi:N-acetylmuramoyl-L-alanine amidase